MDFLESFAQQTVRETAGSRSSNRFDYQKNWSLCELLELHFSCQDYLMVFEHHDDVVVFDSESTPSNAIFYQVKTKTSGNWTVSALTKSKDKSPSILAKLYANHQLFSKNVKKLVFTSNQPVSTKLKNGEKSVGLSSVKFTDLSSKDKELIRSTVEPKDQSFCDVTGLMKIETEKNCLSLSEHSVITKGKLVEFFESLHPECEINISLIYKTFFDEIRRKTNYENGINSATDLLSHKSIGKSNFQKMISAVLNRTSDSELWTQAHQILNAESYGLFGIRGIKRLWDEYVINKMNATNEFHAQFSEDVKKLVNKDFTNSEYSTYKEICSSHEIDNIIKKYSAEFERKYVEVAVLYEVLRNEPIQTTHQKLKEEAE